MSASSPYFRSPLFFVAALAFDGLDALPAHVVIRTATGSVVERRPGSGEWFTTGTPVEYIFRDNDFPAEVLWHALSGARLTAT